MKILNTEALNDLHARKFTYEELRDKISAEFNGWIDDIEEAEVAANLKQEREKLIKAMRDYLNKMLPSAKISADDAVVLDELFKELETQVQVLKKAPKAWDSMRESSVEDSLSKFARSLR